MDRAPVIKHLAKLVCDEHASSMILGQNLKLLAIPGEPRRKVTWPLDPEVLARFGLAFSPRHALDRFPPKPSG